MDISLSIGERITQYYSSGRGEIRYIFAPFIQNKALDLILPKADTDTIIITRWQPEDLLSGVSDPHIFEICRENNYTLKIHPRLHAKAYSWDLEEGLIGSANLTQAGMGIGDLPNVEVLSDPIQLPIKTKLKLRSAAMEARLVTQSDYEKAIKYIETTETKEPEYGEIDLGKGKEFLVSHLPMTEDPELLVSILAREDQTTLEELKPILQRCLLHDITSYSLSVLYGKPKSEVRAGLRDRFEDHSFIQMIIENMDPCMHFGEMKALVQQNCEDVPTPSRRELTENVQVLYNWFPIVSPTRFKRDIPGQHSERICDKAKSDSK